MQQDGQEEQVEEISSSSKSKEDLVLSDDYGSEEEDEDSPLASAHRLVTRSTPKKPISRPKRKAYKSKGSGLGGSSRKQSKGQTSLAPDNKPRSDPDNQSCGSLASDRGHGHLPESFRGPLMQ